MGIFQSTRDKDNFLGQPTKKKFLKGIIKDGWKETVYERDDFWAITVVRNESITDDSIDRMEEEFKAFLHFLRDELSDNVISVDTENKAGTYFIVYLKK